MTIDDLIKMSKATHSVVALAGKDEDGQLLFLVIGAYATNDEERAFLQELERFASEGKSAKQ